jgi:hypothetical protein
MSDDAAMQSIIDNEVEVIHKNMYDAKILMKQKITQEEAYRSAIKVFLSPELFLVIHKNMYNAKTLMKQSMVKEQAAMPVKMNHEIQPKKFALKMNLYNY